MIPLPYETIKEAIEKEEYIRKLPRKKRRFVEAFCLYLDVSKTAQVLRMKPSRCYRMLQDPEIQLAIKYNQELISLRNNITIDYFISELKRIIEDKQVKPAEKINAIQLLAKITGFLKEKEQTSQQMVVVKWDGININNESGGEQEPAIPTIKIKD